MSKELVEKKEAAPPAVMAEMASMANVGFDGMSVQDAAIPYLMVLQSQSPQVKKGPGKVEGAEEGDFYNSVTQRVYKGDKGIRVIPCAFRKAYVEWVPKTAGGGFVASYDDDAKLAECHKDPVTGRDMLPNGNHLVATAYHYALIVEESGAFERVVISMASTQLKVSRRWNSQMMALQMDGPAGKFTPPPFSHSYLATTKLEQKDSNTWYGWNIGAPTIVTEPGIFAAAMKFWEDVRKGFVKAKAPDVDAEAPAAPTGDSKHF
jgi:hypothetical protein